MAAHGQSSSRLTRASKRRRRVFRNRRRRRLQHISSFPHPVIRRTWRRTEDLDGQPRLVLHRCREGTTICQYIYPSTRSARTVFSWDGRTPWMDEGRTNWSTTFSKWTPRTCCRAAAAWNVRATRKGADRMSMDMVAVSMPGVHKQVFDDLFGTSRSTECEPA